MCWRGPNGALDVETLTRAWLGWRRLECNGADMGGVHRFGPDHSGSYRLPALWAWRDLFAAIPRRCEHDPYWPGCHATHVERVFGTIAKVTDRLTHADIF